MAALKTSKRRPVARTKETQDVTLDTIGKLKPVTSIQEYHQLFMNVELLMGAMLDYGVHDEVITIINTARIAQNTHDLDYLHKYLAETNAAGKRFQKESMREAAKAEADVYSPEATVNRLTNTNNPATLRVTSPAGCKLVTLNVTARLSMNLPPSAAKLLRAEQVYGAFWTIKAKCLAVPRGMSTAEAVMAFSQYKATRSKLRAKDYRLLAEYRVVQNTYPNVDIYMLTDLPSLVALRNTKILELGIATLEQIEQINYEEHLPIIDKAKLLVSRLPAVVSADSRNYIMYRLVEDMLLDNKRTALRKARYKRDGQPKESSPATIAIAYQKNKIASEIAVLAGVDTASVISLLINKEVANLIGPTLRNSGRKGWDEVTNLIRDWQQTTLRKYAVL